MKSTLVLFLTFAMSPSFAYQLDCRGGAPETIGFQLTAAGKNQLYVGFKGGTKPSGQGLAPGECSWPDRGFRAGEPTNLCVQNVSDIVLHSTSTGTSTCIPKAQMQLYVHWSKSAPWLDKIRDENNYFTVNVNSDGARCMVVAP